jgi:hypothetical protein
MVVMVCTDIQAATTSGAYRRKRTANRIVRKLCRRNSNIAALDLDCSALLLTAHNQRQEVKQRAHLLTVAALNVKVELFRTRLLPWW